MFLDSVIGPNRDIRWVIQFWPVLVSSFVFALAATWLCKKIAVKFGIVDTPDHIVKTHKEPIAYLGGLGMLVGLTVGVLVGTGCLQYEEFQSPTLKRLLGILAG